MAAGFIPWHTKVQPNHDKLLKLQIKKLKREILVLDKELAETPPGPADTKRTKPIEPTDRFAHARSFQAPGRNVTASLKATME